jgi:hypothetical protein
LFNSKLIYLQNHTSSSRKKKEGGSIVTCSLQEVAGVQIQKGRAWREDREEAGVQQEPREVLPWLATSLNREVGGAATKNVEGSTAAIQSSFK